MPHIEIQVLEGVFDQEDKARILKAVINAFGEAAGGDMKKNTAAKIIEVKSGDWAYGDSLLETVDGLRIRGKTDGCGS